MAKRGVLWYEQIRPLDMRIIERQNESLNEYGEAKPKSCAFVMLQTCRIFQFATAVVVVTAVVVIAESKHGNGPKLNFDQTCEV
jgi:hypothetical protein